MNLPEDREREESRLRLEHLNAELQARARERDALLEAATEEMRTLSYVIAHDLRSPLTSIDGFALLLESCDPAQAPHYIQRIRAAVRQMSELTDAMLSLTHLAHVELELEDVDLAALARAALAQLCDDNPRRVVTAEIPEHLWVRGDGLLLTAVMANLLGNAWKFSARKPEVWLQVGCDEQGDETAYFVADRGAGFDMDQASGLFGAFQRVHAPAEFEGLGIGLALVRKIIASHGGRIWAQAQPDAGATFYFTLPATSG